jgi:DNA helicase II / ATP-dependent DNA helicase PcrA
VPPLEVGAIVEHATFGEGQVADPTGAGTKLVASVDFGGEVGVRRLLVAYAGLRIRT